MFRMTGLEYTSNSNEWMIILNELLMKWDQRLERNVLLLIDNCPAHVVQVTLKHIRAAFLPASIDIDNTAWRSKA